MRWAPYAVVRVVAFFSVGILTAIYFPLHNSLFEVEVVEISSFVLYTFFWVTRKRKSLMSRRILLSSSGFLVFFVLGYSCLVFHTDKNYDQHISNAKNIQAYTFKVVEPGEEKSKTLRYKVEVTSVKDSIWKSTSGDILLYLKKDMEPLVLGGTYFVVGTPDHIQPPMNPGEFNYKKFLEYQNIYDQHFLYDPPLALDKQVSSRSAYRIGHEIRSWAQRTFNNHIDNSDSRAIALALVLGIKDDLNNTIRDAYAASGAMHVLAVSGLHVGIIYFILITLFGRLQSFHWGRWLFVMVALTSLWMYALVTGFSPSVSRAVTMFSFVIVAKAINRKSNIINTLSASALVLLFFDPYLIMSVGFQLSYLAVMGIVFLQPRIYNLWLINNYLLDKVWAITAVSIAAQLATFPLGLLYFHQFPTFFLISNLVIIPAAFIILICGIALLFFSWIPFVASWLGVFLGGLINWVNTFIFWIEGLPNSRVENVFISPFQTAIIVLIVILFNWLLITKNKQLIYILSIVSVLFMASMYYDTHENKNINKLTFYKLRGNTAVDWITNGQCYFWTDSTRLSDSDNQWFNISPNRIRLGVNEVLNQSFHETTVRGIRVALIGSKKVLVLGDVNESLNFNERIVTDLLVYTQEGKNDLEWVKNNFSFERLLIGGDVYSWKANRLVSQAEKLNLSYYSIHHEGAFEYEL